ncbi:hypothetical protein GCM10009760_33650 [Kitasatospora kazusensis]|uniref:Uncharacterized protein n=1 Tax=Kitasatospora kazusensis TaxID=407974 RepID=A0ABP5LCT7_9ACTN
MVRAPPPAIRASEVSAAAERLRQDVRRDARADAVGDGGREGEGDGTGRLLRCEGERRQRKASKLDEFQRRPTRSNGMQHITPAFQVRVKSQDGIPMGSEYAICGSVAGI